MARWEIDLQDGSTRIVEADSVEEAQAEQARLNADLAAVPPPVPQPAPGMLERAGNVLGQAAFGPFYPDPVAGLAEMGSAAMQATAQGLDFLGPGTINAALRLGGADAQLPTFEEAAAQVPGSEGGFMEPGPMRNLVRGAGGALPGALGMLPVAGRNVATPAGALAEFAGLGAARPQAAVAPLPGMAPQAAALGDMIPERASTGELREMIQAGSESVQRMGREVDPYTGRLTVNPAAIASARQGLDEGFVSMIQAATPETRSKLREMLDAVERGREFFRARSERRPLDVAGESMAERLDVVKRVNESAGRQLDSVAEQQLKGQSIDVSPAIDNFIAGMRRMGIDVDTREAMELGFEDSDIALAKGPMRQLKELVDYMAGIPAPDAYRVHQLKRGIDELVTYGKSKRGLGGRTETLIKRLRRDLDSILDQQFPEYDRVNTEYSQTIEALDELQSLVGKKNDLFDQNSNRVMGTLLRRIESNAQSGPQVLRSMERLDNLARQYSTEVTPLRLGETPSTFNDDIRTQVLFADQLNRMFGTPAGTSFQGEIAKVAEKTAEDVMQGQTLVGALRSGGKWALDRARGINEDNALRALRELLEQ